MILIQWEWKYTAHNIGQNSCVNIWNINKLYIFSLFLPSQIYFSRQLVAMWRIFHERGSVFLFGSLRAFPSQQFCNYNNISIASGKKKICKNRRKWNSILSKHECIWPRIKIICQKSFNFSGRIFAWYDVSEVSDNSRTCPAVGHLWLWCSPIRASLLVTCPRALIITLAKLPLKLFLLF